MTNPRVVGRMLFLLFGACLAGCAPSYAPSGNSLVGGFEERELEPGIWRVRYSGNGYTNAETAQTYWLYRCAELASERGFQGFQVLSNIQLVTPDQEDSDRTLYAVRGGGGFIYVPMYGGGPAPALLEADIRLLRKPFETAPPRVFDATELRNTLQPLVLGKKCSGNNVCPHVHHYLFERRLNAPSDKRT